MSDTATYRSADIHVTVNHDTGEASVSQEFVLDPPPYRSGDCPCCCDQPTGFTLTIGPLAHCIDLPGTGDRAIIRARE